MWAIKSCRLHVRACSWSRAQKMAFIANPTSLLAQIIESEESVWSTARTNERDDPVDGQIDELIKHGRLLPVIHKFFFKLEKQQACLTLSSSVQQNDFVTVNPENPEPSAPRGATSGASTADVSPSVQLEREDLSVYRFALMCAQFPVLSAPSPPENDPLSPHLPFQSLSVSPQSILTERSVKTEVGVVRQPSYLSTYSTQTLVVSASHSSSLSPSLSASLPADPSRVLRGPLETEPPGVSPTPSKVVEGTEIVSREVLCELVRRSFRQSLDQQLRYEQLLRQNFGRRSKGEILVNELVSQLTILENNAHPFYKPKHFLYKSGYDVWLHREKKRIKQLTEKFWHYQLPPASTWSQYNPVDYHKAYAILLDKVLSVDGERSGAVEPHQMLVKVGTGNVLSATAQRLLQEFSLRYGVGELYCRILYLDRLAKAFDYNIDFLRHMRRTILDVKSLIPHSKNRITMVKQESEILRVSVRLIRMHCEYSFTRIERLFKDSDPPLGIAALIELYQEVFDIERGVLGRHPEPLDRALKRFLKSGFVTRYERQKTLAEYSAQDTLIYPHRLSPLLIHSLIKDVKDAMVVYSQFRNVFLDFVKLDIVALGKMELYTLLNRDAHNLSSQVISQRDSRESVSLPFLALLYRLDEVDRHWRRYIPLDVQSWRKPFVELVLIWMEVMVKQLCQWVLKSLSVDQWRILKIRLESQGPDFSSRVRSGSGVSQVPSEYSATPDMSVRAPSSISSLSSTGGGELLTARLKSHQFSTSLPSGGSPFLHHSKGFHPVVNPTHENSTYSDSCLEKRIQVKAFRGPIPNHILNSGEFAVTPEASPIVPRLGSHLQGSLSSLGVDEPLTPVPGLSRSITPLQEPVSTCHTSGVVPEPSMVEQFLPVSNSVFDLIAMHSRLAYFVANLSSTVAPRFPHTGHSDHLSPELSLSGGDGVFFHSGWIEATRVNLQRKLHKAFTASTKLYVDNLVCMDLCGISKSDAISLIGRESYYFLQNRKDSREVWGCRHEVDQGTTDGTCTGKTSNNFENLTIGMYIRINNVHFILNMLPKLERRLHSMADKYPLCKDPSLLREESDTSHFSKDVGFFSKESVALLEHVKKSQSTLVHLLCLRMNMFVKEVVHVLLDLFLPGYTIEQRLKPLFAYLNGQQTKLAQYLFPECFQTVMKTLWLYIIKDFEDKALELTTCSNETMVGRSRSIRIVAKQMMKHFYNCGKGVDVGHLITASVQWDLSILNPEYRDLLDIVNYCCFGDFLFTVLNYCDKAASRLGPMYRSLQNTKLDPLVPLSSDFLRELKEQLQSLRKSFSGQEFTLLCSRLLNRFPQVESLSCWNGATNREENATNIGQLLLQQGILVHVDSLVANDSQDEVMTVSMSVVGAFDMDEMYHFCTTEDLTGYRLSMQQISYCFSVQLTLSGDFSVQTGVAGEYDSVRTQTLSFLYSLLLKKCTSDSELFRYRPNGAANTPNPTPMLCNEYMYLFKL